MSSTSSVSLGRMKYLWNLRNKDNDEEMIEKNQGTRGNTARLLSPAALQ